MSMKGKSSVLNTFAISKIFYYLFCQPISSHYIKLFQTSCFKFIWGHTKTPGSDDISSLFYLTFFLYILPFIMYFI